MSSSSHNDLCKMCNVCNVRSLQGSPDERFDMMRRAAIVCNVYVTNICSGLSGGALLRDAPRGDRFREARHHQHRAGARSR